MPNKRIAKDINYAWEWFKFHADQRTKVFNFYLLVTGALLFGLIQIIGIKEEYINHKAAISLVSILGIISSIAFYFLEKRNEELVNCGRKELMNNQFAPYKSDVTRENMTIIPSCIKECLVTKYLLTHSFVFKCFIYLVAVLWITFLTNEISKYTDIVTWAQLNQITLIVAGIIFVAFFIVGLINYNDFINKRPPK